MDPRGLHFKLVLKSGLPLVAAYCRFRKNEGGVDQFAEGYKTFGFQRWGKWYIWPTIDVLRVVRTCQARVGTEMDIHRVASRSKKRLPDRRFQQLGDSENRNDSTISHTKK